MNNFSILDFQQAIDKKNAFILDNKKDDIIVFLKYDNFQLDLYKNILKQFEVRKIIFHSPNKNKVLDKNLFFNINQIKSDPLGILNKIDELNVVNDMLRLTKNDNEFFLLYINKKDKVKPKEKVLDLLRCNFSLNCFSYLEMLNHLNQSELIYKSAEANLPTEYGNFKIITFKNIYDFPTTVALVYEDQMNLKNKNNVLVRIHSECLTGDIFASLKCDCGAQLHNALELIAEKKEGVLIYLRGQEGRGIGITNKIKAYALQEKGFDTLDANLELHLPIDNRNYFFAAKIINYLNIKSISLISNNPLKKEALKKYGIKINKDIHSKIGLNEINNKYINTKIDRMGHNFG